MGRKALTPFLPQDKMDMIMVTLFPKFIERYNNPKDKIYSLKDNEKMLGYPPDNTTAVVMVSRVSILNLGIMVSLQEWKII